MKKFFLIQVVMMLCVKCLTAQEPGIQFLENKSWQQVLALSAAQDKLIFLDCFTSWCGPCKGMAKEVFPLPEVGAFMNPRFINISQDMEKGDGIELNKKYKKYIPGYPTYLLINAKGEVVHQVSGYNAADKFIAKIKDGLQERSWIGLSAKYDEGQRDWEFIQSYLEVLEDAYQKNKIKQVTDEMLPRLTLPVITSNAAAYKVFRKYWNDAESPLPAAVISSPGLYRKNKDPEKDIKEWGGRLYKKTVEAYILKSLGDPKEYDVVKAKKVTSDLLKLNITAKENMTALMLLSQAVVNKDGENFLRLYGAAREFGLLEHERKAVSNWARYLAANTTDKVRLRQYLACAELQENDNLTTAEEIRNYAFILGRMGDEVKAREYYAKADQEEAAFKEKFKAFLK